MDHKTITLVEGNTIKYFFREYFFLSNFYGSEIEIRGYFYKYPTVEHFYQSCKTLNRSGICKIVNASLPSQAKKLGKNCKLRDDWKLLVEIKKGVFAPLKIKIMKIGLEAKFTQHEDLKQKLLATGNMILEEGNDWGNTYWGKFNGIGENYLGRLLMELRDELRQGIK